MSRSRMSRGYHQSRDRKVRVFPDRGYGRRGEAVAHMPTAAGLEQARHEAEAQAAAVHDVELRLPESDGRSHE